MQKLWRELAVVVWTDEVSRQNSRSCVSSIRQAEIHLVATSKLSHYLSKFQCIDQNLSYLIQTHVAIKAALAMW